MKFLKIVALGLVVFVLGSVAVGLGSVGKTVNDGNNKADAFSAVRDLVDLGDNEATVLANAGEPESKQRDQYRNYNGNITTTDYWYYGVLSENGWQLVFENNKLRAINQG